MLSCIQALLRKGSDVNHKNLQGFSPLHIAVRAGEKFSMEILRELVTRGYSTDVNIPESLGKRQYTRVTRLTPVNHLSKLSKTKLFVITYDFSALYV